MFAIIILFILSVSKLINSEEENCRRIPINGDKIFGECCVFIKDKDLPYENDHILVRVINATKESSKPIKNRKRRQLLHNQKSERFGPFQTNTEFVPRKPIIAAGRDNKEEMRNTFTPASFQNQVVPIESDKFYGECDVYMEDEYLRHHSHEIIIAMIKNNLSPIENFEGHEKPPLTEGISKIRPTKLLPDFDFSSISSRTTIDGPSPENHKIVYSTGNLQDVHNKDISHQHGDNDEAYIGIDDSHLEKKFNISYTKDDPEISLPHYKSNERSSQKNKVRNSTTLEQRIDDNTFSTGTTEKIVTPGKKCGESAKCVPEILKESDSSDVSVPTTSTTITGNGTMNSGNTTVVLDNRNAVDVPPLPCPVGQGRVASGECVPVF